MKIINVNKIMLAASVLVSSACNADNSLISKKYESQHLPEIDYINRHACHQVRNRSYSEMLEVFTNRNHDYSNPHVWHQVQCWTGEEDLGLLQYMIRENINETSFDNVIKNIANKGGDGRLNRIVRCKYKDGSTLLDFVNTEINKLKNHDTTSLEMIKNRLVLLDVKTGTMSNEEYCLPY